MKNKLLIITLAVLAAACSQPEGDKNIAKKKEELDKTRTEFAALKEKMVKLEKELAELDPEFARQMDKSVLVSTFIAEAQPFVHKVEVRGAVESRRNVSVGAQTAGEIVTVKVQEGQQVTRGQVLVELDAQITRNSIAELKTQLDLATTLYNKQAKLWEQKIGTEVQYLQAKNNKESLERRLSTAYAQLDMAIVKAPFNGIVDEVHAKVGEMASPGIPLVGVVSLEESYLSADVSERFVGRFKAGDPVDILFPILGKKLTSKIISVGQVINSENRTFEVEVAMPRIDFTVKPNQVVVMQLLDYVKPDAFSVPTRLIQRDEIGQYVYVVVKDKDGHSVADKLYVTTGVSYEKNTEIIEGLKGNELVVDQGFRDLTDGVEVKIADAAKPTATK